MIPSPSSELRAWLEFVGAMSVLAGVFGWQREGSEAEDEMIVEASNVILEALSDADQTRTVSCVTNRNWREDVTIEEAIDLHEERELRRWQGRN